MSDRFRCEQHMRNCVDRCPDCDRAEIERLRAAWHWAAPHLAAYAVHYPNQDYIAAFEHHRRALEGK